MKAKIKMAYSSFTGLLSSISPKDLFGRLVLIFKKRPFLVSIFTFSFGLVLWVLLTDLDFGVHAVGKIENKESVVKIQFPMTGRIKSLSVREGQQIKAGDVLVEIEEDQFTATAVANESRLLDTYLKLESNKIELENIFKPLSFAKLPYTFRFLSRSDLDKSLKQANAGLSQRLLSNQAQRRIFLAEIDVAEKSLAQTTDREVALRSQISYFQALTEAGLLSSIEFEERKAKVSSIALQNISFRSQMILAKEKLSTFDSQLHDKLSTEISSLGPQLHALLNSMQASLVAHDNAKATAPVDGVVQNLKFKSVGEVVGAGQLVMELVPRAREFRISATVPPAVIENLRAGMEAEVKFYTLPSKSPYVYGKLVSVSDSAITNDRTGEDFYNLVIDFTEDPEKKLQTQLVLGMPVDVLLKGGTRSVINYLTSPITSLLYKSMREQ